VLDLTTNNIGDEGAGRLAGELGQCFSLAKLHLSYNGIHDHCIAMLRACWPGDSGLEIDDQFVDDEKEAFDMGDGSSEESGQESEGEESGQESEEED
jgi:hypothetical protein